MAKISQPLLKFANQQEREMFAQKVLAFINPKYNNENNQNDVRLDFEVIVDFSRTSDLTSNEFLLALQLSADGKLFLEGLDGKSSQVKLFREIDRLKLGEVQQAYIQYRNQDKQYEQGEAKIKAYRNPPPKLKSKEEQKKDFIQQAKKEFSVFLQSGTIRNSVTFYKLLRVKHKEIKLDFVEAFLNSYDPEKVAQDKALFGLKKLKVVKVNARLEFEYHFLKTASEFYKFREMNKKQWLTFWLPLWEVYVSQSTDGETLTAKNIKK